MKKKNQATDTKKLAMQKAKTLIAEDKLDEAKRLLETIEHPLADKWLQKLEGRPDKKPDKKLFSVNHFLGYALITFVVCGAFFALIFSVPDDETSSSINTVIPTSTLDANAISTQTTFRNQMSNLRGIYQIAFADVRAGENNTLQVYLDVWAIPGHDVTILRSDVLELSSIYLGTNNFSAFTVSFDDGITSTTFTWTGVNWETITRETFITPTNTPRPLPTQRPQANVSSGSTGSTTSQYPENCAEAVEMGLTAQQAAQWGHLDRDTDGVACYGD